MKLPQPAKRPNMSVSAADAFHRCARKWWFAKIARVKIPPSAALKTGIAVHDALEAYLRHGTELPEGRIGAIAKAGVHLLPDPRTVGVEAWLKGRDCGPLQFAGKADMYLTAEGPPRRKGMPWKRPKNVPGVPWVGDHKTSSDPSKWGKNARQLAVDPQTLIYAYALLEGNGPPPAEVSLSLVYYRTRGLPLALRVDATASWQAAVNAWSTLCYTSERMVDYLDEVCSTAVPATVKACGDFGGCPFVEVCSSSPKARQAANLASLFTDHTKGANGAGRKETPMTMTAAVAKANSVLDALGGTMPKKALVRIAKANDVDVDDLLKAIPAGIDGDKIDRDVAPPAPEGEMTNEVKKTVQAATSKALLAAKAKAMGVLDALGGTMPCAAGEKICAQHGVLLGDLLRALPAGIIQGVIDTTGKPPQDLPGEVMAETKAIAQKKATAGATAARGLNPPDASPQDPQTDALIQDCASQLRKALEHLNGSLPEAALKRTMGRMGVDLASADAVLRAIPAGVTDGQVVLEGDPTEATLQDLKEPGADGLGAQWTRISHVDFAPLIAGTQLDAEHREGLGVIIRALNDEGALTERRIKDRLVEGVAAWSRIHPAKLTKLVEAGAELGLWAAGDDGIRALDDRDSTAHVEVPTTPTPTETLTEEVTPREAKTIVVDAVPHRDSLAICSTFIFIDCFPSNHVPVGLDTWLARLGAPDDFPWAAAYKKGQRTVATNLVSALRKGTIAVPCQGLSIPSMHPAAPEILSVLSTVPGVVVVRGF